MIASHSFRARLLIVILAAASFFQGAAHSEDFTKSEGQNWQLEVKPKDDGAVVIAVPKANPAASMILGETVSVNTTRVFLSRDDDVALVESGSASLGTSLQVFLLTEGSEFLELKEWDVTEAVQKAWEKASGKKASKPGLHFVAWSADAKAALVRWGGGEDTWYAVVDFDKHKVGTSMDRLNAKAKKE